MNEKRLIPCQLNKSKGNSFLRLSDASIFNINLDYASTITSRYYKGIGANHDNMVIEVKQIGNLWGEDTDFKNKTSGRAYDKEGISPALNTMQGGRKQPMIVAMRGRNPENPNSRQAGLPTEQRLEPNLKGISNTLTSVQKDNLVLEGISTKGKVIDMASTILAGCERTNMTGFNADNGVLEYVNIKQATKDGYIRCRVGGDSRPFLPGQQDEEGESTDGG